MSKKRTFKVWVSPKIAWELLGYDCAHVFTKRGDQDTGMFTKSRVPRVQRIRATLTLDEPKKKRPAK